MFFKKRRAFTLIELLIVMAIIAILAGIAIVSYSGTQRVARDTQRKSDLLAIGTAYKMHYQDKKAWNFNHEELLAINPTIASSTICEGSNYPGAGVYCGAGYFNYLSASNLVSMAGALSGGGYLSKSPLDPQLTDPNAGLGGTGARQYMKWYCYQNGVKVGMVLFAKLETSTTAYSDSTSSSLTDLNQCYLNTSNTSPLGDYVHTNFTMNYGIIVK